VTQADQGVDFDFLRAAQTRAPPRKAHPMSNPHPTCRASLSPVVTPFNAERSPSGVAFHPAIAGRSCRQGVGLACSARTPRAIRSLSARSAKLLDALLERASRPRDDAGHRRCALPARSSSRAMRSVRLARRADAAALLLQGVSDEGCRSFAP